MSGESQAVEIQASSICLSVCIELAGLTSRATARWAHPGPPPNGYSTTTFWLSTSLSPHRRLPSDVQLDPDSALCCA